MREIWPVRIEPHPILVDDVDFDWMSKRHLSFRLDATSLNRKFKTLLGIPHTLHLDHINGDHLDYRRSNLRGVTHKQNCMNRKGMPNCSSKYKGVSVSGGKWVASISLVDGGRETIGFFDTEEGAAKAYDIRALELYGQYARVNFDRSVQWRGM